MDDKFEDDDNGFYLKCMVKLPSPTLSQNWADCESRVAYLLQDIWYDLLIISTDAKQSEDV